MKKRVPDKFWFPWWPDKWIFGSVRIECTPAERGIWVDLLSIASKDNGHIRANEETPYPIAQLAGMLIIPEKELNDAINKFIKLGKLIKTKTGTLYIAKWEKYQFSRTARFYAEKGRGEQKDSHSEQKSKEYNKLNEIKVNQIKLKEDTKITETLILLSKVKNYPYDAKKDLEFIKSLKVNFPDVDVIEKITQIMLNWLNFPLSKKSRPRVQIRRWVTNEQKWQKEGEKGKKVGESTHIPLKKEDDYTKARVVKMKELQEKYQSEIDKATKAHASDWLDEIDNKIKEEIAEFSHKYGERK